ncbi:hypothetical protein FRC17_006795, partial [Serendipita sp. 399]
HNNLHVSGECYVREKPVMFIELPDIYGACLPHLPGGSCAGVRLLLNEGVQTRPPLLPTRTGRSDPSDYEYRTSEIISNTSSTGQPIASNSPEAGGRRSPSEGMIVGISISAVVLVMLPLVILWLWWDKRRARKTSIHEESNANAKRGPRFIQPFTMSTGDSDQMQSNSRHLRASAPPILKGKDVQRQDPCIESESFTSLHAESVASTVPVDDMIDRRSNELQYVQLLEATSNSRLDPTMPIAIVDPGAPTAAGRLAQTFAPNLSEGDLERLAENIVSHMRVSVIVPPRRADDAQQSPIPYRNGSRDGTSLVLDDPPPPWRDSWNGSHRSHSPAMRV